MSRPVKPQRLPNRWAVVIGISRYQRLPQGQQLKFADADAQAFYDFIRSPRGGGFRESNVQFFLNETATTAKVRWSLGTWLPRNVKQGDIVYIYFASHGMAEPFGTGQRAYWVTNDADPQDLNTTAVPMDEVKKYVEEGLTKAAQVVFITDCCRAGYLGHYQPRGKADEALISKFLDEVGKARIGERDITKLISDIGVIEFYSAFAKKVRTGEITEEDFRAAIRELAEDIQSGVLQLVLFGDSEKKEAALIEKHGASRDLRTLDAMHFAVMKRLGSHAITHIYCADRPFAALIQEDGFSVIDPEDVE